MSATNPRLFIGGCPRSGTTLLQRMLDHHPELAVVNDSHFVIRALERHSQDGYAAARDGRPIALDQALVESVWSYHRFYRLGADRRSFEQLAEECETYQQLVTKIFDWYGNQRNKPFAGEKTPDYVRHAPALLSMFPQTRFVTLVRDGRDVALSLLDWAQPNKGPGRLAWWDRDPVATAALWWREFAAQTPDDSDRTLLMRYEALVDSPLTTLQSTCAFLQLKFDEAVCLPTRKGMRSWRRDLDPVDVATFECLASDQLERFAYPLSDAQVPDEARQRADAAREWFATAADRRRKSPKNETKKTKVPADQPMRAIFRRERNLPALRTALNDASFQQWLASDSDTTTESPTSNYLRYKPQTNCLVGYQNSNGTPWGFAVALPPGTRKLRAVPGAVVDTKLGLIAYRFPSDTHLPSLEKSFTPEWLAATLDRPELVNCELTVLSYKPQRRCVLRIDCEETALGVLRVYSDQRYSRAAALNKQVAEHAMQVDRPQRLASSDRHQLALMSWLPGDPLTIAESADTHEHAAAVLAEIHAHPNHKIEVGCRFKALEAVNAARISLCDVLPTSSALVNKIFQDIAGSIVSPTARLTLTHGDYHPGQLLRHAGRLGVVDWDNASNAAPALDLANYVAHLHLAETRDHRSAGNVIESFLTAYHRSSLTGTALLDAHIAAALLRVAIQPFRHRWQNWPEATERLLAQAQEYASRTAANQKSVLRRDCLAKVTRLGSDVTQDATERTLEQRLREITSAEFGRTQIAAAVAESYSLPIESVTFKKSSVEKIVPERRALVGYHFEYCRNGGDTQPLRVLGKVRQKGLDAYAYDNQRILHSSLNGSSDVQFARCVGALPEHHLWLQSEVAGVPAEQLITPSSDTRVSARIGKALAELHHADLPAHRIHTFADELRILGEGFDYLANRHASWKERLLEISTACESVLSELTPSTTGIHRDFYPAQVIVSDDSVTIVDNDLFARGPAVIDVGNFLAHLQEQAFRLHGDVSALQAHEQTFTDAYLEAAPDVTIEAIRASTLVSLARHIYISHRIVERRPQRKQLISICEERLRSRVQHESSGLSTT